MLDVIVTEPHMQYPDGTPVEFAFRADCPLCGDHSFARRIRGGVGIITLEEKRVLYEGAETRGDTVYLRTSKGKVDE